MLAQSPRPSPEQEQAKPPRPQNPAAPNQQGAAQPPIIVNVVPPPKTEKELTEERHERDEKAKLDNRVVDLTGRLSDYTGGLFWATVGLAIGTGLLVVATAGLVTFAYRQSRDTQDMIAIGKQSAQAAADSAFIADKALRTTQRAYISVEPDGIRPYRRKRENQPVGIPQELTGHYIIRNVGNLPARELGWNSFIVCSDERNFKPAAPDDFVGNIVITPGTLARRATAQISSTEFLLFNGKKTRYCYVWGRVRYLDGLGEPRTTDFCHRYNCVALREDNTIPEEHARIHEHGNEAT